MSLPSVAAVCILYPFLYVRIRGHAPAGILNDVVAAAAPLSHGGAKDDDDIVALFFHSQYTYVYMG